VNVEIGDAKKSAWSGPLAVLINRGSASASEIFAAAMQDYGRGIIIGERNVGKGTMQTIVNLDQMEQNDKPEFGELKITIAQIFRINGDSTQLRGVTPDINFPSSPESERFVESNFDNALPWAKINPASYLPRGKLTDLLPELQRNHALRIANEKSFQVLRKNTDELKSHRDEHVISLNETERRTERAAEEARFGSRPYNCEADPSDSCAKLAEDESITSQIAIRHDSGFDSDKRDFVNGAAAENFQENIEDAWLHEAAHILSDEAGILSNQHLAIIPQG